MLKRVNNNAYKLELPEEYKVHATFNVTNLIPFACGINDEVDPSNLSTNPSQASWDLYFGPNRIGFSLGNVLGLGGLLGLGSDLG